MIGSFTTDEGTATLDDSGVWSCGNAAKQAFLNALYSPLKVMGEPPSRAMPWWGKDQVVSAANYYGVAPQFPPVTGGGPEVVF